MSRIKIFNGKLITPYRNRGLGYVVVENGRIADVGTGDAEVPGCENIDAGGRYIAPGFIDIHTHGAGNHDFMDGTPGAFPGAARMHAIHGTTLLYPTTLTGTNTSLFETFDLYRAADAANTAGAAFGGLHLEGPYFAPGQKGAQDPRYLRNPKPEEYLEILERGNGIIARWSLAPELDGAPAFGRALVARGIIPAIAHTDALYEQVEEAFENGFRLLVHFYSCMSTISRRNAMRYAGVIESGYGIDEMDIEIIGDGIHVPKHLLNIAYKIKGAEHIALVTDSMRGAGMPDGHYKLGSLADGQEVKVVDGVAKLLDDTAFAGSVATMDRCVRTMYKIAETPLTDAVRMATATPARIMGVSERKGSLVCGKDADIVIFDDNIDVAMTMTEGEIIYNNL
jgi:N-acetylglucosamine-6-phosphate deacetylase